MQESEIALVKRMQDGDETAFDDLYHIYYDRATAIAYRYTNDHADAQDVVQDTFLQVHKSIHTLQNPQHFYSWLCRIIHSKCVNLFYRNRNENAVDPSKLETVRSYEEKRRYMLPKEENNYVSEQEVLQKILLKMDDKYREVIVLAYFRQMKLEEIAKELELPLGTVKTRCRRAKEELKVRIAKFEQVEHRRISFNADALFPGLAIFSFAKIFSMAKQKVHNFMLGQTVNVVCIVSLSVLAVSGTVMAVQDYERTKQEESMQEETKSNPLNGQAQESIGSFRPFGSYMYDDISITSSREAYYVCLNWGMTLEDMQKRSKQEKEKIKVIYEALKQGGGGGEWRGKEKGWENNFLSLE